MWIESTEHFCAWSGFRLNRGRNEIDDSEFAALPEDIKRKLRILESHGVVRVYSTSPQGVSR